MEYGLNKMLQAKNEGSIRNEVAESVQLDTNTVDEQKQQPGSLVDIIQVNRADSKFVSDVAQNAAPADIAHGDVNMEASIRADDVLRAGGFGARDDISSFLPVASDSTDFEASLRDARDYEEPQEEICRPGLGWMGATK
ncbi:unnamed protein product [Ilex paraguariensis]|uniref:Uncharacterized protein n=1 Tax=Ilex paraguariensis TaxID=185542 RepID=A0ABC8URY1_9AQUA